MLIKATGLTKSQFAKKYSIPCRPLGNWCANVQSSYYRNCPSYILIMLNRLVIIDFNLDKEQL